MNYYKQIKDKILDNEIYEKIKEYSKERHRVLTYFEIGRLLHEAGKHYGESIIKNYSIRLTKELGSKYNDRTLRRMRQFYVVFSNSKWSPTGKITTNIKKENPLLIDVHKSVSSSYKSVSSTVSLPSVTKLNANNIENISDFDTIQSKTYPLVTNLTWSHYLVLLSIKDQKELDYYIQTTLINHLTKKSLN